MRFRPSPVIAFLAGGLAYSLLAPGVFGVYDTAARAAVCGGVAALAALLLARKKSQRA